jgi:hypothetical protein
MHRPRLLREPRQRVRFIVRPWTWHASIIRLLETSEEARSDRSESVSGLGGRSEMRSRTANHRRAENGLDDITPD